MTTNNIYLLSLRFLAAWTITELQLGYQQWSSLILVVLFLVLVVVGKTNFLAAIELMSCCQGHPENLPAFSVSHLISGNNVL